MSVVNWPRMTFASRNARSATWSEDSCRLMTPGSPRAGRSPDSSSQGNSSRISRTPSDRFLRRSRSKARTSSSRTQSTWSDDRNEMVPSATYVRSMLGRIPIT